MPPLRHGFENSTRTSLPGVLLSCIIVYTVVPLTGTARAGKRAALTSRRLTEKAGIVTITLLLVLAALAPPALLAISTQCPTLNSTINGTVLIDMNSIIAA